MGVCAIYGQQQSLAKTGGGGGWGKKTEESD